MLRPEPAVQYKRFIKRVLVDSVQSVFTKNYPDPAFQNLKVTLDHPLVRDQFPSILLRYTEREISNMGIGHFELSPFGQKTLRYRFEGNLEFTIYTLSPLERDVLSDSLIELLAFGRLQTLTNTFFDKVYNTDHNGSQLLLNTDQISALGDTEEPNPWGGEDQLVYRCGYTIKCHGNFYSNSATSPFLAWVDSVDIVVTVDPGDGSAAQPQTAEDTGYTVGRAEVS